MSNDREREREREGEREGGRGDGEGRERQKEREREREPLVVSGDYQRCVLASKPCLWTGSIAGPS